MKSIDPVRFIFKGDAEACLQHTGRARLLLQQAKERMGVDKAYWTRTLPDGTKITVSSLGGINQAWIETTAEAVFLPCQSQGFLAQLGGFGKGYLSRADYSQIQTSSVIDEYVAGRQSWFSEDGFILSWDAYGFRYGTKDIGTIQTNIYRGGCLYAVAPSLVTGVAVFETFLIVNCQKKFYYTNYRTQPYGDEDPGWVELYDLDSLGYDSYVKAHALASPDGSKWIIDWFDQFAGGINTWELSVALNEETGLPVMSYDVGGLLRFFDNGSALPTPASGGTYYWEPEIILTDEEDIGAPYNNDREDIWLGWIEAVINPAFSFGDCDTEPQALSVTIHPPEPWSRPTGVLDLDLPPLPEGVRRWYISGRDWHYDHSMYYWDGSLPPCASNRTASKKSVRYGTIGFPASTGGTSFDAYRDFDIDGSVLKLTINPYTGTAIRKVRSDSENSSFGEAYITGQRLQKETILARLEYGHSIYEPAYTELYPGPFDCTGLSNSYSFSEISASDVATHTPWNKGEVIKYATRDDESRAATTNQAVWEIGASITFAGRNIQTLLVHYASGSKSVSNQKTGGTTQTSYIDDDYDGWDYSLLNWCYAPLTTETDLDTYSVSATEGSGLARVILDFDLRSGCILLLESRSEYAGGKFIGSSRIYWDTPNGEVDVISVDGLAMNGITQHGKWSGYAGLRDIIYYLADIDKTGPHEGNVTLDQCFITPNFDDTLLYCKGTLLGEEFELMTSLYTAAGGVINGTLTDERTMIKLAAL